MEFRKGWLHPHLQTGEITKSFFSWILEITKSLSLTLSLVFSLNHYQVRCSQRIPPNTILMNLNYIHLYYSRQSTHTANEVKLGCTILLEIWKSLFFQGLIKIEIVKSCQNDKGAIAAQDQGVDVNYWMRASFYSSTYKMIFDFILKK